MGFNSELLDCTKNFDKDTLLYLSQNQSLLEALKLLGRKLNLKNEKQNKQIIRVINNKNESALFKIIGINSTSLVSSELEGSITFTFIRDIKEILLQDNIEQSATNANKEHHLTLLKH